MPAPIDYLTIRNVSTHTLPKLDINVDPYEFQPYQPQSSSNKDAFESRELEASFCRDFACCGLILNDLHDLLQHYEECHVRLEEDDVSDYEEDNECWSPSLSFCSSTDTSPPNSPLSEDFALPKINFIKKKAAAYLSDLYNASTASPASLMGVLSSSDVSDASDADAFDASFNASSFDASSSSCEHDAAFQMTEQEHTPSENPSEKSQGKKRSYQQLMESQNTISGVISGVMPSAMDLLTQSAAKKVVYAGHPSMGMSETPASMMTDEEFLAQAGVLLATTHPGVNVDKPYKCPVLGCDKAYKNPNGLKYHNQHGHCNLISDENENIASKPYQCTIGDCGKRYKNLNGLKYHIEHSHMTALNHTLATFGSTLFHASSSLTSLDPHETEFSLEHAIPPLLSLQEIDTNYTSLPMTTLHPLLF